MKHPFEQVKDFKVLLRDELLSRLPPSFKPFGRKPVLRRKRQEGHDLLMLWDQAGARPDPGEFVFSFIPGRSFDAVARISKSMGTEGTLAQIQQLAARLRGLGSVPHDTPVEWSANVYGSAAPLAEEMAKVVLVVSEPFYSRFTTMVSCRDALVGDDPWCTDGVGAWANVLMLDIALNDVERFRRWAPLLSQPVQQQAEYLLGLHQRASSA